MPASTAWIQITPDDVRACVLSELLDLTNARAAAGAQAAPFDTHSPKVIARVRSKVASNPKNRLSADATLVPPELGEVTALLIAYAIVLATATTRAGLINDNHRAAIKQAEKDLDDVAAGKYAVSIPPDAEAPGLGVAATAGTIVVVTGNRRVATREGMRGL